MPASTATSQSREPGQPDLAASSAGPRAVRGADRSHGGVAWVRLQRRAAEFVAGCPPRADSLRETAAGDSTQAVALAGLADLAAAGWFRPDRPPCDERKKPSSRSPRTCWPCA